MLAALWATSLLVVANVFYFTGALATGMWATYAFIKAVKDGLQVRLEDVYILLFSFILWPLMLPGVIFCFYAYRGKVKR